MAAASFRGVPFLTSSTEGSFGRRLAEHEFPGKDLPFIEDLGESIQGFNVEGIVIGADVSVKRNRIIEAARKSGVGELIHPTYGVLSVRCKAIRVSEVDLEQRLVRFQFTFIQADSISFPIASATPATIQPQLEASIAETKSAFARAYDYISRSYSEAQSVQDALNQALLQIGDAKALVASNSDFKGILDEIKNFPSKYLVSAETLADQVFDLLTFGLFKDDPAYDGTLDQSVQFQNLIPVFNFAPAMTAPSSASGAFVNLMQEASIISAAILLSQLPFESSNQAREYRDIVLAKIDALLQTITDDIFYSVLWDTRSAIALNIEARAADLSLLTAYPVNEATPGLVVANILYGSVDQEQDILRRNKIKHPGFISGTIEVLLNAG
jgi:prophage DNA circulation protein